MGPYTRQNGIWGFYEVLQAFNNDTLVGLPGATAKGWEVVVDGCYMTPYAVNGPYWIGYDDLESIKLKSQFINYRNLGGALIFSLDTDDFRGDYSEHKYPMTMEVLRVLSTGETLEPGDILGVGDDCGTAPMCQD